MNTTEIESALINLEATYPELCERIQLPEQTCGGRTCHALQIAKGSLTDRPGILIIGGVHAREWGGPDIVVNFAADLLRAYANQKGLKYLKKIFAAADVRAIVEGRSLVVVPCVNPDGVEFSHKKRHLWRKNRNDAYAKGDPEKIGVDINRNYDFLWDFKKYFHPAAWTSSLASEDPTEETYHGPSAFSEPETRNVRWLMDRINPAVFLDLHSYAGDVLFSWGNDEDQTTDPDQNFTNPAYNGQRGRIGDSYREYIGPSDYQTVTGIARMISDAMRAVSNRPYKPLQGVGLYPTSGTGDDYAASRHVLDPSKKKMYAFTLEFNFDGDAKEPFLATANPKVLDRTMREVIPGLITLCLVAPTSGSPGLS